MHELRGVEIFASGKHNGDEYTEKDIDEIITAFTELDFKPPLKAGHSEDKKGAPSLGWVANLRKEGGKLLADFVNLPTIVYNAIKERRYDTVSSEIYINLTRGGKKYAKALKAVALLGAEIPAVAGLLPLHELFAAEGVDVKFGDNVKVKEFDDEKESGMTIEELMARVTAAEESLKAEKTAREAVEATLNKALTVSGEGGVDGLLRKLQSDDQSLEVKTLAAKLSALELREKAEREAREASEAQRVQSAQRIVMLEEEQRRSKVGKIADVCRVPALREYIAQFADLASRGEGEVKVKSADGKDVPALARVESLVRFLNENAAKLFLAYSSETPAEKHDADASKALDAKAKEYLATNPSKSYLDALRHVTSTDPVLKQAYANANQ